MPFEIQFLHAIQQFVFAHALSVSTVIFLARWCIFLNLPIAILLLYSMQAHHRHAVLEAAWSAGLALLFTSLISYFVHRSRPFLATTDISLLIPPPFNTSFPSGHTATAFAIAAAFAFADLSAGIASFSVAFLVAFGRMAVGVHYPSDILGGMVVGLVSFAIVRVIHHALLRRDVVASAKKHAHE